MSLVTLFLVVGWLCLVTAMVAFGILSLRATFADPQWRDGLGFSIRRRAELQQRSFPRTLDLLRSTRTGRLVRVSGALAVSLLMTAGFLRIATLMLSRQGVAP